jgi:glycolate oxidase FAD binding subunit
VSETLSPTTEAEVLDAIRGAVAGAGPLDLRGLGSKTGFGRPAATNRVLSLAGISGVTLYEPDELVLSAGAGTSLAEIEALLARNRQMLAFEPMHMGALYRAVPAAGEAAARADAGSLGGAVACNLAGPRRIKAGAARDHVLGFRAVSGRGEAFKSGGRVVKNVTGYDLSKLVSGSMGTLAALTEITVKVLPAPEKSRTVLIYGLADDAAVQALSEALNSPHEVAGAAHLPAGVAARSAVDLVSQAGRAVTAIRVEGPAPSVAARCLALREQFRALGAGEELHTMRSARLWVEIRDVAPLLPDAARDLWRVSVPPAAGPAVAAAVRARFDAEALFDWGGGLVWLALRPRETVERAVEAAAFLRATVAPTGGHATLMRAGAETRRTVPPFHPEPDSVAVLSRRVKEAFDPVGILPRF